MYIYPIYVSIKYIDEKNKIMINCQCPGGDLPAFCKFILGFRYIV